MVDCSFQNISYFNRRKQEVAVKFIKNQESKIAVDEFFSEVNALEAVRCPQVSSNFH